MAGERRPLAASWLQLLCFAALCLVDLGSPGVASAYAWQVKVSRGVGRAWLPSVAVQSVLDKTIATDSLVDFEGMVAPPGSGVLPPPLHRPRTGFNVETEVAGVVEFAEVADLRLSVFTPYPDGPIRQKLRVRAREKMIERRVKGATCLVARPTRSSSSSSSISRGGEERRSDQEEVPEEEAPVPPIIGTLECSTHEFDLAPLSGTTRRLYVTEVAVADGYRRRGVARALLRGVDDWAREQGAEAIYLHVDVENDGALGLYHRAGFVELDETVETYNFAAALGLHSGSFSKTRHVLMCKAVSSDAAIAEVAS
uniref:N-acetyltransferase domain-containing protein n=1 Tax=Rhizochromulina marina TaxID=1034831 RepID=A0A6U0XL64_9STRA